MKKLFFTIGIFCIVSVAVAQSRIQSPSEIYRQVVKSTVTIVTDAGSLGSGFYVAPNVVATNYHVVEGATKVKCILTNTSTELNVTGYVAVDKNADLILLKVTGAPKTPLRLAHGNVATGQIIYAIGSPQGMEGTISDGIVSSVRKVENITLIQITAPISQGSSGGPIINRVGEVVGISTLIHSSGQNLNFAVNYSHLQTLMRRMKTTPTSLVRLSGQSSAQTGKANTTVPETSGSFRSDFSIVYTYDPETETWDNGSRGNNTFVFNANDNNDVIMYYASGKKEVLRKISAVHEGTNKTNRKYQSIELLDEKGTEVMLFLYEDGDVLLVWEYGGAILLTNE
jgi:hypothetical protein